MSPQSVIPKANTVRTQFAQAVAVRVEQLLDMALTKTDEKLRAHFDGALKSGQEPYPPPHYQARIVVLSAADFASGNNPGAQGPFDKLQDGSPDAEKLTKALTKALTDAGFQASVEIDTYGKELTVVVTDPQFRNWARSNNVDHGAQAQVQETLRKRHERDAKERAATVLTEIDGPTRAALKSGLAAMKKWDDGASGSFDVPAIAAHDSHVVEAAINAFVEKLQVRGATLELWVQGAGKLTWNAYFDDDKAAKAFKKLAAAK